MKKTSATFTAPSDNMNTVTGHDDRTQQRIAKEVPDSGADFVLGLLAVRDLLLRSAIAAQQHRAHAGQREARGVEVERAALANGADQEPADGGPGPLSPPPGPTGSSTGPPRRSLRRSRSGSCLFYDLVRYCNECGLWPVHAR